ncbi:MAG TPA: hypothetical protein VK997_06170, partial [Deferrisomatales bacterium]|nr:hypothetical protein [Deferrisomatales bacterium]
TTVTAAADLSVTITDTPDPFESGQPGVRPVLYTVTLANAGPNAAEAVVLDVNVTDDREGLTPVSVTVTGAAPFTDGTCTITGERTVRCEAASLTSGGSLSFNVQANLQSTSAVWATATVVSSSEDPDPINNSAREDTRGATYLDLELTASGGGAIYRGTRVTYSFQVTNHGPGPGSGSNRSPFSFVFPEGFVLVEIPTGDPKCTQEGQTVSCYSYLAAGASVSGEITVTAPGSPGDFEVLALLDHDTGDYHDTAPGNNGMILATPVVGEADFTAAGIEVSQGIQNLANDMPLVAGRATVVRGYASSSAHIRGVPGRLRGFRGGIEVEGSPLMPGNAGGAYLRPDGGARTDPYQGWWFVLPQTWRSATLELSLEVDPDEALPDPDRTDNTVATTVTFHPGEVLNLAVVPMHLHQGADPDQPEITFFASDPDFPTMFQAMQRYHPVGWVNLWIRDRPLFPRGHARGNDWNLRFADTGGKMLNRLQRFRLSANDPVADLHYMGMVDPRADSPHMGGLGQRPGHVAWTEMSRSPAAADTETAWYQPGGKTLAHELGHNLGLRHVPCKGDEAGADEAYPWPFPECRLSAADPAGYFGLDVFFGQGELWGDYPAVISNDPNDEAWNVAYPMMGYAVPRWSSPYEYCQLLVDYGIPCTLDSASGLPTAARVLSGGGEGLSRRAFDLATATRHLAVSGTIDAAARTVEMDPPLLLTSPNATAVADAIAQLEQGEDSGYMVAQLDASGAVLDEQPLYRGVVEAGMTAWAFTQLLEAFEGVAAVEVRHAGGTLARAEASAAPPTVQLLAPAGGSIEDGAVVRWASADPDGDALEFTLYYSPDGGAGWFPLATGLDTGEYDLGSLRDLPGSTRGRFRVVVYDGFHTAVDDSDADLTVPGSNPVPVILQPGDQASVEEGTPVFLRGLATDPDQGSLGPDALVWSSDRDGALGSGVDLATGALSPGRHIVTLAATDDQGGFGATSITLIVGQDDGGLQPPDSDDGGSSGGGPCFIEMLGGQMGMNWRRLFLVLTGLAVVAYPRRN